MEPTEEIIRRIMRNNLMHSINDWHGCRQHRYFAALGLLRQQIERTLKALDGMAGEW
ncbi:hypothetical protein [Caballeronia sp. LZ034LL]|uniref:hypothetical protein n=1 Tax=Caballeronia sp. LZ034LL TaxID=3038567 RepID=UPI0028582F63|nr:hypothetical protein [Caballeronia sp. LZ034LL]MDR5839354.1 hypothetical protein [Caballeronia sp. LZ034LL]